jgi:hypothetical protein
MRCVYVRSVKPRSEWPRYSASALTVSQSAAVAVRALAVLRGQFAVAGEASEHRYGQWLALPDAIHVEHGPEAGVALVRVALDEAGTPVDGRRRDGAGQAYGLRAGLRHAAGIGGESRARGTDSTNGRTSPSGITRASTSCTAWSGRELQVCRFPGGVPELTRGPVRYLHGTSRAAWLPVIRVIHWRHGEDQDQYQP